MLSGCDSRLVPDEVGFGSNSREKISSTIECYLGWHELGECQDIDNIIGSSWPPKDAARVEKSVNATHGGRYIILPTHTRPCNITTNARTPAFVNIKSIPYAGALWYKVFGCDSKWPTSDATYFSIHISARFIHLLARECFSERERYRDTAEHRIIEITNHIVHVFDSIGKRGVVLCARYSTKENGIVLRNRIEAGCSRT